MNHREVMQQALEALEAIDEDPHATHSFPALSNDAITALRTALAQQEQEQEPVAWIYSQGTAKVVSTNYVPGVRAVPLFIHPPRRETEQEPVALSPSTGHQPCATATSGVLVMPLAQPAP